MPLIEIARAATQPEALEGLDRWKARHADVVGYLEPPDVMVDAMRGRSTTWTRIRVNLRHVPAEERPSQEALEVDYDPWEGVEWSEEERAAWRRRQSGKAQAGGDSPT
jgi:bifunctional non-homologous end joining protein LigD